MNGRFLLPWHCLMAVVMMTSCRHEIGESDGGPNFIRFSCPFFFFHRPYPHVALIVDWTKNLITRSALFGGGRGLTCSKLLRGARIPADLLTEKKKKNVGRLVITVDMKQSINECDHQQKINKQSNVGAAAVWPAVNEKTDIWSSKC